jgi:hypothetical protein
MIGAGILFFLGGVVLFQRENSYWSDGTRKISRDEAEESIIAWRAQTRRENGIRGGKRTKKYK